MTSTLLYIKNRHFRYGIITPWMNSPIVAEAPGLNSWIRKEAPITIPVGELGRSFGHSTNSRRQCIRSDLGPWNISLDEVVKEGG